MPESFHKNLKLAERGELRLIASCRVCGHGDRLDIRLGVSVVEGRTSPEKIGERLRCTKCGNRCADVTWAERWPRKT
jgi:hypothetical protein